jgi:hypothetical protein
VSREGIHQVALIRRLTAAAGIGTARAVSIADQLLTGGPISVVTVFPGLDLRLDRPAFQRVIDLAITEAVEAVAPARRGRPPSRLWIDQG